MGMLKRVLLCGVAQAGYLCGGLLKEGTFMRVCSRRVYLWWKAKERGYCGGSHGVLMGVGCSRMALLYAVMFKRVVICRGAHKGHCCEKHPTTVWMKCGTYC